MEATAQILTLKQVTYKQFKDFLDSLDDAQRRTASFEFAGHERYEWAYTPIDRNGLLPLSIRCPSTSGTPLH